MAGPVPGDDRPPLDLAAIRAALLATMPTGAEERALRAALADARGAWGYTEAEAEAVVCWAIAARLAAGLVNQVLAGALTVDVAEDGRVLPGGAPIDVEAIVATAYATLCRRRRRAALHLVEPPDVPAEGA